VPAASLWPFAAIPAGVLFYCSKGPVHGYAWGMYTDDIDRVLLTHNMIARRVKSLAHEIAATYEEREIVIVPVLTGSMIFMADLIRWLPLKMRIDVVAVSSYPGRNTRSRGASIMFPGALPIRGREVLIVDDILESGQSLAAVAKLMRRRGAKSVKTCALLRKPQAREKQLSADFLGFDIPDEFVVGYGMDYNHYYRNLPYIAVLKSHILSPAAGSPRRTKLKNGA
jgi:hypoxanthine phosphoribosyltransferase